MKSKTLTIQLNGEDIPILPPELTGNRAGLLLLAKSALGMAETLCEDGFHIHLDDLYAINAEGKTIIIRKDEGVQNVY